MKVFEDSCAEKLEELYYRYRQSMLKYAFGLLKNKQDAEDCVQDVFERVFRIIRRLDLQDKECTERMLIVMVGNRAVDIMRKRASFNRLLQRVEENGHMFSDEVNKAGRLFSGTEHICGLSEKYAVVMKLRYLAGLEPSMIAKVLGMSEHAVNKRIYRARKILKKLYFQRKGEHIDGISEQYPGNCRG